MKLWTSTAIDNLSCQTASKKISEVPGLSLLRKLENTLLIFILTRRKNLRVAPTPVSALESIKSPLLGICSGCVEEADGCKVREKVRR